MQPSELSKTTLISSLAWPFVDLWQYWPHPTFLAPLSSHHLLASNFSVLVPSISLAAFSLSTPEDYCFGAGFHLRKRKTVLPFRNTFWLLSSCLWSAGTLEKRSLSTICVLTYMAYSLDFRTSSYSLHPELVPFTFTIIAGAGEMAQFVALAEDGVYFPTPPMMTHTCL